MTRSVLARDKKPIIDKSSDGSDPNADMPTYQEYDMSKFELCRSMKHHTARQLKKSGAFLNVNLNEFDGKFIGTTGISRAHFTVNQLRLWVTQETVDSCDIDGINSY